MTPSATVPRDGRHVEKIRHVGTCRMIVGTVDDVLVRFVPLFYSCPMSDSE